MRRSGMRAEARCITTAIIKCRTHKGYGISATAHVVSCYSASSGVWLFSAAQEAWRWTESRARPLRAALKSMRSMVWRQPANHWRLRWRSIFSSKEQCRRCRDCCQCHAGVGGAYWLWHRRRSFAIVWSAKDQRLYGLNASGRSPASLTLEMLKAKGLSICRLMGLCPYPCPVPWMAGMNCMTSSANCP